MRNIIVQFDSLKFVPVQNITGELFAFNADDYPNRLFNSADNSSFTCYSIDSNGNLTDKEYVFKKEELTPVWVKVIYS